MTTQIELEFNQRFAKRQLQESMRTDYNQIIDLLNFKQYNKLTDLTDYQSDRLYISRVKQVLRVTKSKKIDSLVNQFLTKYEV